MATKKQTPKKAAKSAKPAKKAPAKKPAAAKKPIAKKAAPKKAPAKKHAPAPKKVAKVAPKKAVKAAKPIVKAVKKPAPVASKVALPAKKAAVPARPLATKAVSSKEAHPVKKPAVAATTSNEVKPAIKPLTQANKTPLKPLPQPVIKKQPVRPGKFVIPKTSTNRSVKYDPDFTRSVLDSPQHHENTGPTMRYSDAELVEFRELIQKKLDTAKKELAYLQGLITRKDEGDMEDGRYMTMEDGSMSMEREQLSQMASRQIQFIDHLEKAVMRIENKTYGICRVTGKLIDKARLRAVPHATLSIEAKQMMNK